MQNDKEFKKVEVQLDKSIKDSLKDSPEGLKVYKKAEAKRKAEERKKAAKGRGGKG